MNFDVAQVSKKLMAHSLATLIIFAFFPPKQIAAPATRLTGVGWDWADPQVGNRTGTFDSKGPIKLVTSNLRLLIHQIHTQQIGPLNKRRQSSQIYIYMMIT